MEGVSAEELSVYCAGKPLEDGASLAVLENMATLEVQVRMLGGGSGSVRLCLLGVVHECCAEVHLTFLSDQQEFTLESESGALFYKCYIKEWWTAEVERSSAVSVGVDVNW